VNITNCDFNSSGFSTYGRNNGTDQNDIILNSFIGNAIGNVYLFDNPISSLLLIVSIIKLLLMYIMMEIYRIKVMMTLQMVIVLSHRWMK